MIKVIEHIARVIVAAAVALLCLSCDFFKKVDGSGNVTTENRTLKGDFTSVTATNGLEVIIVQSNEKSVTVEADDNLHQHIITEVSGGNLEISSDVNIRNAASKTITVKMPIITGIESNSGGQARSTSTIKADKLELTSTSGSEIEVSVESKEITCESSAGSKLKVTGSTENLEAEAANGSYLYTDNLVAKKVRAEASSGANLYTNPTEALKAEASSGGHIYYKTTPGELDKKVSTGGTVSQQ